MKKPQPGERGRRMIKKREQEQVDPRGEALFFSWLVE
jgi:hypothetical protein